MKWSQKDIEQLPVEYQKQIRDQVAVSNPNMEQCISHATEKKNEVKKINPPVNIHVHSKRKSLADADGLCAKWVIDEIVDSGILPDDNPKNVHSVSFSQEKGEPEETIVTIEEVEDEHNQ